MPRKRSDLQTNGVIAVIEMLVFSNTIRRAFIGDPLETLQELGVTFTNKKVAEVFIQKIQESLEANDAFHINQRSPAATTTATVAISPSTDVITDTATNVVSAVKSQAPERSRTSKHDDLIFDFSKIQLNQRLMEMELKIRLLEFTLVNARS